MKANLMTLNEAAEELRISERQAYVLARSGRLPGAFKLGKLWRIKPTEFRAWLDEKDQ